MAYNKVIYDNKTLIDLTEDTVKAEWLLYGAMAHNSSGVVVNGSLKFQGDMEINPPILDSTESLILDSSGQDIDSRILLQVK